ncbi:DUF5819 family protein [Streptomyces sp. NPDC001848]|uniref:DUF5819 family protein n=1 Tax=Streptomyces sp. NPDC001848 TaxID=3364618 RepID=UPI003699FA20
MDAYDKGPDARPDRPGDCADPVSALPEGVRTDIAGEPGEQGEQRDAGGAPSAETAASPESTRPESTSSESAWPKSASPESPSPKSASPESASESTAARAPRTGIAALSLRYQVAAALALAVVAVAACVHLGMVFLHVAPPNTLTKKHGKVIDDWIYPEFEQNWKLFAPNPLQQNIDVQVRAQVRTGNGGERTTGWYDLSALDGAAIHGNLLPSHTQQNELRRAWDFYAASHDGQNRPAGLRGALSEDYLRRVVVVRLDREHAAGRGETLESVQVRSRISDVPPPKWSDEQVSGAPVYRQLPWWPLPDAERTGASA